MYQKYKDRVAFYVVYIEEAHASDGWQLGINENQGVVFANPKSDGERDAVAEACVRKLNIEIPALVDGVDNAVERAYKGWPDRIYLLDKNGKVRHKSAPGPFGFRPAQLETVLKGLL